MLRHNKTARPDDAYAQGVLPLSPASRCARWLALALLASIASTSFAPADDPDAKADYRQLPGSALSRDKKSEGTDRAEARIAETGRTELSLAGRWQLTLPAGFKRPMAFKAEGKNRFRFLGGANAMTGLYEIKGRRLVVIEPDDRRLTEYQWEIVDANTLKLVASPPVRKIGSDYTGAILKRRVEKEGDAK